jgi:hypothetical protein
MKIIPVEQAMRDIRMSTLGTPRHPTKAATLAQGSQFNLSKLPPGTDLLALLAKLPAE